MSAITFSGLATGIDSASIISQLMQLERRPVTRLQSKQKVYDSQASKLRSYETKLKALKNAAAGLKGQNDVLTTKVSSSNEAVFTASANGSPTAGPTTLHVTSLAAAEKTFTDGFADADAAGLTGGGDGTLSITVGAGAPVDITVTDADTLESLVTKINDSGADVTAGIVFDGTSYRMRVVGNQTGAANAITFGETNVSLGLDDPANERAAASDAVFTVDGLPMTRTSNRFSDAVPGVTISLTGASEGAATSTLEVSRDPEKLREKVQTFVDSYNDVMKSINAEFAYTGKAKGPESLAGDSTLRGIQSRLRSAVGAVVGGTSGAYTTLASIGVQTEQSGLMKLDAGKLDAALAADEGAIARLFAGDGGANAGFIKGFDAMLDEMAGSGGTLRSRVDSLEGRKRDLDGQISRMELRLDDTELRMRKQYAALEQLVSGLQAQGNQMTAALVGLQQQG